MAELVVRKLVDDIDGTEIADGAGERVEFSFRGVDYQIDLTKSNATKFEKVLKPYTDAAAKVRRGGRGRQAKAGGNGKTSPEQLAAIREWARKNGHEVADRGRIKAEIVEAFEAAHQNECDLRVEAEMLIRNSSAADLHADLLKATSEA